jgi:hypothetical protein
MDVVALAHATPDHSDNDDHEHGTSKAHPGHRQRRPDPTAGSMPSAPWQHDRAVNVREVRRSRVAEVADSVRRARASLDWAVRRLEDVLTAELRGQPGGTVMVRLTSAEVAQLTEAAGAAGGALTTFRDAVASVPVIDEEGPATVQG